MSRPVPTLDADKILATLGRLQHRIRERFPDTGLNRVAADLRAAGEAAQRGAAFVGRPHLPTRIAAAVVAIVLLGVLLAAAMTVRVPGTAPELGALVQGLESAINDVVFVGIAIWFLATLETRLKRRRALAEIHGLRSLAHVVDMHQLTKDPGHPDARPTPSSPPRTLSRFALARYLDYCSELLSLTSKLAALYARDFSDPVVLSAVNEVETLTTGLSNKVWQKIMILDTLDRRAADEE